MPTIDQIVKTALLCFKSQQRIMISIGFDFEFGLDLNVVNDGTNYSERDSLIIEPIVQELYNNAKKAIYGGSNFLRNEAEFKDIKGRISFRVSEDDEKYLLACQDNGCGIPEINYQLIFRKGFSTMGTSGFGLGILRRNVDLLRGKVYFESKVGIGTTFFVELPK